MNRDSLEVQLVRLDEQHKTILSALSEAKESRKHQYERIEHINLSVNSLNIRMGTMEASFAKAAPTIEEFVKIKQRVIAAGLVGKWLWVFGGLLLTAVYKFRSEMLSWLIKH